MKKTIVSLTLLGSLACVSTAVLAEERHNHSDISVAQCDTIIAAARLDASTQSSKFRAGNVAPKYHYACVNRAGRVVRFASDADAWEGSRDIAKAKAYTAMAFSSDQNALTSRTIFCATQPGGPLWAIGNSNQAGLPQGPGSINQLGIIQFPGGVPVYIGGKLVGGFGVSGDDISLDEETALAGTTSPGWGASDAIKSSHVLGVSYQLSEHGGDCFFSPLP